MVTTTISAIVRAERIMPTNLSVVSKTSANWCTRIKGHEPLPQSLYVSGVPLDQRALAGLVLRHRHLVNVCQVRSCRARAPAGIFFHSDRDGHTPHSLAPGASHGTSHRHSQIFLRIFRHPRFWSLGRSMSRIGHDRGGIHPGQEDGVFFRLPPLDKFSPPCDFQKYKFSPSRSSDSTRDLLQIDDKVLQIHGILRRGSTSPSPARVRASRFRDLLDAPRELTP